MAQTTLAVLFLVSLAALALGDLGSYKNSPITDMSSNQELTTNGFTIVRGGQQYKVPQGYGWCQDNAACGIEGSVPSPTSSCYSKFYFNNVSYSYPNCGSNGLGFNNNFNNYNMTYEARLYLLDLDYNGYGPITDDGSDPICTNYFPNFCYTVMWAHNIRAGFGCRQYNNQSLLFFNGATYQPPCQNTCYHLLTGSCSTFGPSVLRGVESPAQFCELFPTSNCWNAGVNVSPAFLLLALTTLLTVAYTLLL